ncbi:MAG: hypothetical protein L7U53_04555 [Candidatus Poseidoniaceae archaeon]|nr:hypothetical protein [Candidatus Poseidoniaceae archaeon]
MDKRAKVCLIIGGILLLVGIGGFALGVSQIDDIEEAQPVFVLEEVTNGTLMVADEDGQGDAGFTFFVKGTFIDANNDDVWDHCQQTSVTVTNKPAIVRAAWSSVGHDLEGEFYNEVLVSDSFDGCDAYSDNKEFYHENSSYIKLGRACFACGAGEFSFESNQSVYVINDDDWSEAGTPIAILVLGFISGFGSLCCGIIFLIVGTILVFTLKDETVQPMMMNQDGGFVIQQNLASTSQITQRANQTVVEPYSSPQSSDDATESMNETAAEPYSFPSTDGINPEAKEE